MKKMGKLLIRRNISAIKIRCCLNPLLCLVHQVDEGGQTAHRIGATAVAPARVIDHGGYMIVDEEAGKAMLLERFHYFKFVKVAFIDKALGKVGGIAHHVAEFVFFRQRCPIFNRGQNRHTNGPVQRRRTLVRLAKERAHCVSGCGSPVRLNPPQPPNRRT